MITFDFIYSTHSLLLMLPTGDALRKLEDEGIVLRFVIGRRLLKALTNSIFFKTFLKSNILEFSLLTTQFSALIEAIV